MHEMKLFNTLTGRKEEFKAINNGKVSMYTCGPTVYDVAHIGNLRKYICDDLLLRTLQFNGLIVKRVMNITDVDDKTIRRSEGNRRKFSELTREYEKSFFNDLGQLNIIKPEIITRATEYIDQMVAFICDLLNKGFAYKAEDGSVYFSICKFKDYGKLSRLDQREVMAGARVSQDEYNKENPSDFALWKAWDQDDGEIYWETSLGKGRPGWHIECSTMAMDQLGETIDIHTGGVDNIFPHHENEIAQSEAKTSKKFVDFWVHNEHLLVDGKKMSKSLNNFYRLSDIVERGYSPLDFRYFIIGAHYRSKINFTWDGLEAAKNTRERLLRLATEISGQDGEVNIGYLSRFREKVSDDIEMPLALAILWEMMRDQAVPDGEKYKTLLEMNRVLGIGIGETETVTPPEDVLKIAKERRVARENRDYAKSDELRDEIARTGWMVEDLPGNEYKIVKK
jgi:cysteinyl-tRNA synthetase